MKPKILSLYHNTYEVLYRVYAQEKRVQLFDHISVHFIYLCFG